MILADNFDRGAQIWPPHQQPPAPPTTMTAVLPARPTKSRWRNERRFVPPDIRTPSAAVWRSRPRVECPIGLNGTPPLARRVPCVKPASKPATRTAVWWSGLRHTYLHFVLDPLIAKRATALQQLKPVLVAVQKAPMADDYKFDPGLLVVECVIRAIEARTPLDPKLPEKDRQAMLQRDEAEGFIFTRYFYDELRDFEKENTGLQDAFPDWLHHIDVDREKKRANEIEFASQAAPEVMRAAKPASQPKVELAERELMSGDPAGAQKLAEEALDRKSTRLK